MRLQWIELRWMNVGESVVDVRTWWVCVFDGNVSSLSVPAGGRELHVAGKSTQEVAVACFDAGGRLP